MKLILYSLFLLMCSVGFIKTQMNMGSNLNPVAPPNPKKLFMKNAFQFRAQTILNRPDLQDDLRQRVVDLKTNAEQDSDNCGENPMCLGMQMGKNMNALKLITMEQDARSAASEAALAATATAVN